MVFKETVICGLDCIGVRSVRVIHAYGKAMPFYAARVGSYVKGSVVSLGQLPSLRRTRRLKLMRRGYIIRGFLIMSIRHSWRIGGSFGAGSALAQPSSACFFIKRRGVSRSSCVFGAQVRRCYSLRWLSIITTLL